jgi:alkylhydroperoxidase/carboxymuconolactone decarboxylase family protein YurZ
MLTRPAARRNLRGNKRDDGAAVSKIEAEIALADAENVRNTLEALRADRGFVLPHHGLLAAALPELEAAYGPMYRALTVDAHYMAPLERECVWLALLACRDEPVGTHHVALFRQHGGDDALAAAVFRHTAWAMGAAAQAFLARSWAAHFPGVDPAANYRDGAAALDLPPLAEATARLLRLAVHAARDQAWALEVELEAAYRAGLDEGRMVEAISLIIWPCGVNVFVRAAGTWLGLLRSGRVTPSPAFAAWAAAAGQGPLQLPTGG